jgi:CLIP-associating protein 1/2
MHQEHGLQFRTYVPTLMELLEDADGMVRDVARETVIELFRYVAACPHRLLTL